MKDLFDEITYIVSFYDKDGKVVLTSVSTQDNNDEGHKAGTEFVWDTMVKCPENACSWVVRADARLEGACNCDCWRADCNYVSGC